MYELEEDKHCKNKECKNYWSCKMLKDRFKTVAKGCKLGHEYNELNVMQIHDLELKAREKILKKEENFSY